MTQMISTNNFTNQLKMSLKTYTKFSTLDKHNEQTRQGNQSYVRIDESLFKTVTK